jgi:hypothetical protein
LVRTRALNSIGWIYGELQDHERALEWNTRGAHAAQELKLPDPEIEANARLNLGDDLLALGRLDEAEEHCGASSLSADCTRGRRGNWLGGWCLPPACSARTWACRRSTSRRAW